MLKKTLIVSTVAAGLGLAALPAAAGHRHNHDTAAGALIGGTVGALIGSSVNGSDGAVVGGLLGAVTGAAAASSHGHYGVRYGYAPRYYGGPVYYEAPRYYRAPRYYDDGYRPAHGYGYGYRDRDGDGVPNRFDRRPNNPYRY